MYNNPPHTEAELQQRVDKIANSSIAMVAQQCNLAVPENLQHNKGWIGQLLEKALYTSASNLSEPDFLELGIELKSIPVKSNGYPAETTYICQVPLINNLGQQWQQSCVARKLNKVLWIPIQSDSNISLAQRLVGQGIIWQPTESQLDLIKDDWEELMEYVAFGQIDQIDASYGEVLQIRPKAANSKARTVGVNEKGQYNNTMPRGFYLRTAFTAQIIRDNEK
ncbi:MAG: DNA mismatch repair endonuclease MutH [Gammaproteobacteria bacterium]|nr:DNA mismatch repair endonuclease MutH [Gammaproteobacteria bacterium]